MPWRAIDSPWPWAYQQLQGLPLSPLTSVDLLTWLSRNLNIYSLQFLTDRVFFTNGGSDGRQRCVSQAHGTNYRSSFVSLTSAFAPVDLPTATHFSTELER